MLALNRSNEAGRGEGILMPHPDDLRRWRGMALGCLIALAMWALILLCIWSAMRLYDRLQQPAEPVARTALLTGPSAHRPLNEWYPPARVPERIKKLAAKLEKKK